MSKPVRGVQHTLTLLRAGPDAHCRRLLRRMIALSRDLPHRFDQPLPTMMEALTPTPVPHPPVEPDTVRQLADAVAAWHLRSPLGICLRRSLLRYHFLREAGLPVRVVFGARLKDQAEGGGIGGHAWLTLKGQPYYENPKDYADFAVMYIYPPADDPATITHQIPSSSHISLPPVKKT